MSSNESRITGSILGMAWGDSISISSAHHKVSLLAPKRALRMRTLTEFAETSKQTTRPTPYTHAQNNSMLIPKPSDDTEWSVFVLQSLLNKEDPEKKWDDLVTIRSELRVRTGTAIALKNLERGYRPPESGHDNPHYFDDIAMIRSLGPAILYAKEPAKMEELVVQDAQVTHSEDGIYCAKSFAALISSLINGLDIESSILIALTKLPRESWSFRVVTEALSMTKDLDNTFERISVLEANFVENIYAYPVSAPETLGLLLAHAQKVRSPEEMLLSALSHRRQLDSLPALAGATAGVLFGDSWIPNNLMKDIELDGVSIPSLRGTQLSTIIKNVISAI
ncbi:MAG: hypothetical protein EBZ66_04225 [Actinobacteria bacterium]|nr:hypothetical protein [Actinomycetota bacterium]